MTTHKTNILVTICLLSEPVAQENTVCEHYHVIVLCNSSSSRHVTNSTNPTG